MFPLLSNASSPPIKSIIFPCHWESHNFDISPQNLWNQSTEMWVARMKINTICAYVYVCVCTYIYFLRSWGGEIGCLLHFGARMNYWVVLSHKGGIMQRKIAILKLWDFNCFHIVNSKVKIEAMFLNFSQWKLEIGNYHISQWKWNNLLPFQFEYRLHQKIILKHYYISPFPLKLHNISFYFPFLESLPLWSLSNSLVFVGIANGAHISEDSRLTSTNEKRQWERSMDQGL